MECYTKRENVLNFCSGFITSVRISSSSAGFLTADSDSSRAAHGVSAALVPVDSFGLRVNPWRRETATVWLGKSSHCWTTCTWFRADSSSCEVNINWAWTILCSPTGNVQFDTVSRSVLFNIACRKGYPKPLDFQHICDHRCSVNISVHMSTICTYLRLKRCEHIQAVKTCDNVLISF